jgi:hypothetical protein
MHRKREVERRERENNNKKMVKDNKCLKMTKFFSKATVEISSNFL